MCHSHAPETHEAKTFTSQTRKATSVASVPRPLLSRCFYFRVCESALGRAHAGRDQPGLVRIPQLRARTANRQIRARLLLLAFNLWNLRNLRMRCSYLKLLSSAEGP